MIYLKPNFSDTAIITKSELLFKINKYRFYKVTSLYKTILLIADHEIRKRYYRLHRITDYKFLALERKEQK
jgi:hypothetical protein